MASHRLSENKMKLYLVCQYRKAIVNNLIGVYSTVKRAEKACKVANPKNNLNLSIETRILDNTCLYGMEGGPIATSSLLGGVQERGSKLDENRETIEELLKVGTSIKDIALEIDSNLSTLYWWLKQQKSYGRLKNNDYRKKNS